MGSILGSGFFFCVEAGYCILVGLRWVRRSAVGRIWTVGFEIGLIWLKDRFVCKADKDTSGMRWMRIYSTQVKWNEAEELIDYGFSKNSRKRDILRGPAFNQ